MFWGVDSLSNLFVYAPASSLLRLPSLLEMHTFETNMNSTLLLKLLHTWIRKSTSPQRAQEILFRDSLPYQ